MAKETGQANLKNMIQRQTIVALAKYKEDKND